MYRPSLQYSNSGPSDIHRQSSAAAAAETPAKRISRYIVRMRRRFRTSRGEHDESQNHGSIPLGMESELILDAVGQRTGVSSMSVLRNGVVWECADSRWQGRCDSQHGRLASTQPSSAIALALLGHLKPERPPLPSAVLIRMLVTAGKTAVSLINDLDSTGFYCYEFKYDNVLSHHDDALKSTNERIMPSELPTAPWVQWSPMLINSRKVHSLATNTSKVTTSKL